MAVSSDAFGRLVIRLRSLYPENPYSPLVDDASGATMRPCRRLRDLLGWTTLSSVLGPCDGCDQGCPASVSPAQPGSALYEKGAQFVRRALVTPLVDLEVVERFGLTREQLVAKALEMGISETTVADALAEQVRLRTLTPAQALEVARAAGLV